MTLGMSKLYFIGIFTPLPSKHGCRKRRPLKAVGNAPDYAQESMIHLQKEYGNPRRDRYDLPYGRLMFSDNPSGSKPTSPTMVPSSARGASRKGIDALFAIMTVLEVADEDEGAFFTPEGPRTTGDGTNAWAPAQHTASNATNFMILTIEIVSHEEVQR